MTKKEIRQHIEQRHTLLGELIVDSICTVWYYYFAERKDYRILKTDVLNTVLETYNLPDSQIVNQVVKDLYEGKINYLFCEEEIDKKLGL